MNQRTGRMLNQLVVATLTVSLWTNTGGAAPADGSIRSPENLTPFLQASVVALVRINARTERILTTFEGIERREASGPVRTYYAHAGVIVRLVHLNGKTADDPDLALNLAEIEQYTREKEAINLELGHIYLVLLRRSTHWTWDQTCATSCRVIPAPVELTTDQSGYEVRDGRLHVLLHGGPLDAFDGKTVEALADALTQGKH